MQQGTLSRRGFLERSTGTFLAAGLPLWFASQQVAAAEANAARKKLGPNDKIRMGIVGCGSPESRSLGVIDSSKSVKDLQVVAVCDVDARHLTRAQAEMKKRGFEADTLSDYRKLNDRQDIDAVLVATPDHWHTLVAIDAMRKGKDVYCEKPLTLTVEEALAIRKVAKETGRVLQTGSQQRTEMKGMFRLATELVRAGRIGKVSRIECRIGDNPVSGTIPEAPVPEGLDWDTWLGPTAKVPFRLIPSGGRQQVTNCHYNFRWFYDYSGGKMTDWGAHHLDIAQWALDKDGSGPVAVEAMGMAPHRGSDGYNCHHQFDVTYTYPGNVQVNAVSRNTRRDTRFADKRFDNGVIFLGENNQWLFVSRGTIEASEPNIIKEPLGAADPKLYPSRPTNHMQNFVDCMRSREQPICGVTVGSSSVIVCHIGAIALRTGLNLKWDPSTSRFDNDQANAMLRREMRAPYKLEV